MLVYRLEHRNLINQDSGMPCGPYNPVYEGFTEQRQGVLAWTVTLLCDYSSDTEHLPPTRDPLLGRKIRSSEVCAFDSEESLRKWFGPFVARLERFGFHISCYNVPDDYVRLGANGQCVFTSRRGRRVLETYKGEEVD